MNAITNQATNSVQGFMEDLALVRIPPWWQSPWFILLALCSLALLGLAGRRLYLRWQLQAGPPPSPPSPPLEPPHLTALRQLEELRQQMGKLGAYRLITECSWVLRRYIEARYKLSIVYQTTREFLGHAQTHSAVAEEARQTLGQYLQFCDMVKFARRGATHEEMVQLLDYAVAFVKSCSSVP